MFTGPLTGDPGSKTGKANANENGATNGATVMSTLNGEMLETLLVVNYRYVRFALDEKVGLFKMAKCAISHFRVLY